MEEKPPPCSHKLAAEQFLSDMGLIMSKNIANFIVSSLYHEKLVPVPFKSMVSMVSRSGRHLQRYDEGCRQVVGYALFFILSLSKRALSVSILKISWVKSSRF